MTTPLQNHALSLMAEIWSKSPDVRLGQLFVHLGWLAEALRGEKMTTIEDDEFLTVLQHHLLELNARSISNAFPAQSEEFDHKPVSQLV